MKYLAQMLQAIGEIQTLIKIPLITGSAGIHWVELTAPPKTQLAEAFVTTN